jgi:two-component system sensor histidine kinase HydH
VEELRARTTIFCGVLAFAIALSVLLRGRRSVHLLFAAFATDVAFWYASQSAAGLLSSAYWIRVTAVLTVLLPQFAVHLFRAMVPEQDAEEHQPPNRTEAAGMVARWFARGPLGGLKLTRVAGVLGVLMLALELSPWHEVPLALGGVYFYVFGLLAAALLSLWLRGNASSSRAVRDRVRYLAVVGGLATTFTLADFLSFLGLYIPPIGAVLSIVFLFVLAESLTRPRMSDLYDMVGRLLVSVALAFALAGIFYGFVTYIGRFGKMYLNAVLAGIVFMVLFEPLKSEAEKRIHQFFFRERYDLETSVGELRRRLSHALEVDESVKTLLEGLERSRRITSCAVYLRDADGNGFDLAGSTGQPVPARIESLAARPLLERLAQHASLSLDSLAREPSPADGPILTIVHTLGLRGSSLLLPLRAEEDQVVGILSIADDRVKDAYAPEEIGLLETVAAQVGVTLTNSRLYSRMKERDRLAALGALAAGLAHEIKNPLGAIKGAAQLLEELDAPPPPTSHEGTANDGLSLFPPVHDPSSGEFIGIILEEVNRLDRVVGSFLDYARPRAGNPVPLDINAAVRRTVQILTSAGAQSTGDVDVRLELADELPRASIDPEQFRQVLINLVQNAIQAVEGSGHVTVSTTARRTGRISWPGAPTSDRRSSRRVGDSLSVVSASEADYVEVAVKDTGPGIPQKVLRNLFIPFFTTKERGTGLGLAISQSLVQQAGGTIEVQSQSGAGSKFTIVLPTAAESRLEAS